MEKKLFASIKAQAKKRLLQEAADARRKAGLETARTTRQRSEELLEERRLALLQRLQKARFEKKKKLLEQAGVI